MRAMFGGTFVLLLMSMGQTVPQLVVCRLLQGVFTGTVSASVALVASVTPPKRSGLTLGMMQTAVLIGLALGPLVGGLAADAFGYRVAFRLGAGIIFLGGLFILYGTGANGKSTFLEVIRFLLGDYAQQADFSTFLARDRDGPRNDLAALKGARFVSASEAADCVRPVD